MLRHIELSRLFNQCIVRQHGAVRLISTGAMQHLHIPTTLQHVGQPLRVGEVGATVAERADTATKMNQEVLIMRIDLIVPIHFSFGFANVLRPHAVKRTGKYEIDSVREDDALVVTPVLERKKCEVRKSAFSCCIHSPIDFPIAVCRSFKEKHVLKAAELQRFFELYTAEGNHGGHYAGVQRLKQKSLGRYLSELQQQLQMIGEVIPDP